MYEVFLIDEDGSTQTVESFGNEVHALKMTQSISDKLDAGEYIGVYTDLKNPVGVDYNSPKKY